TGLFSEMAYLNAAIELDNYDVLKAAVENALISTDEEKRIQLFEKALGIVHEECVFIPLSYSSPIITAKKELKGITFNQTHLEFPLNKFYY
ncbi:MAG: nickel ABC transporter, nickel/metallophore periplasmic binding protein, partial [Clostridia bacterium]|nr:nickel ABC transporter, nickel/metallophore periplasmic binding protein [Clostridia bacterium]